jgi:hypothetical protein
LALGHGRDHDKTGNTENRSHLATSACNSLRLEALAHSVKPTGEPVVS